MAHGKVIGIWSDPASDRTPRLGEDLAEVADAAQKVLVITVGLKQADSSPLDSNGAFDAFKGLSPVLFRNSLQGKNLPYAAYSLSGFPVPPRWRDLLEISRRAFDRVYVSTPADASEQSLILLDAVDLQLVWIDAQPSAPTFSKRVVDLLSLHHFPIRHCRLVVEEGAAADGAIQRLATIPALPRTALKYRQAISQLASALQTQTPLYKEGGAHVEPKVAQQVVEDLKSQVQPDIAESLKDPSQPLDVHMARRLTENALAQENRLPADRQAREQVLADVLNDVLGLGPLEPLLKNPEISEIMVMGTDTVYIEKAGRLERVNAAFSSEKQLRVAIDRIVAPLGRRVDESSPLCDARLKDGSRVNIVLPPLAVDGPTVTIRKFMPRRLDVDGLIELGALSKAMAQYLKAAVGSHKNILISGGTGSGKTTLLNALSSLISEDERIVTIEDAAELKLQKPHVVRLEARPANAEGHGEVPIRRLVINALRMRPDRLVIGECRGPEALDMLQAMNTGHAGSLSTIHANTPRDALGRLETLVLMAGMDLPIRVVREQIRSAIHVIVQQTRSADGRRRITSITEVTGMEVDTLITQELFRFQNDAFESTGIRSRWGMM